MKWILAAALVGCLAGSSLALAGSFEAGSNAVRSTYDGDTFNLAFRLAHIDTPEIKGECMAEEQRAVRARDFTRAFLRQSRSLTLRTLDVGYYGRPIVEVRSERGYLNKQLLDEGLAVRYQRGVDPRWCQ